MAKRIEIPVGSDIEHVAEEEDNTLPEHLRNLISEIVDDIDPELRRVLEMREWERLPFRQIAKLLGYKSHASIIIKYNEALEEVRRRLENYPNHTQGT